MYAYLNENNGEENIHGYVDLFAQEDKQAGKELSEQIGHHEHGGQEVATRPRVADVVALVVPLEPHANAVFEECADEAAASNVWQRIFAIFQDL